MNGRPKNEKSLKRALLRASRALIELAPDKEEIIRKYFVDLGWDLGFGRRHMVNTFTKRIKYASEEEN